MSKNKTPARYYFPRKKRDLNAMDVDRLSIEEQTKLMKEGSYCKYKNTRHRANECPNDDDEKKKEEQKKRMNGKELHGHIRALFKDMTEEEKEEFMKEAEESGF